LLNTDDAGIRKIIPVFEQLVAQPLQSQGKLFTAQKCFSCLHGTKVKIPIQYALIPIQLVSFFLKKIPAACLCHRISKISSVMTTKHLFIALYLSGCAFVGMAQDLDEAKRLAETGKHFEAEKIYNLALSKNPDNLTALIGLGYNYSWAGRYEEAKLKFEAALAIEPDNVSALVGKGYNLAWAGQYAAAKYPFQTLERLHPGSVEARKGLAYIYLWQGNSPVAIHFFEDLVVDHPREIEYYIALAQSYLLDNQAKRARIALRSALAIDSSNRVANELLKNTYGIAAPVELDIWTGYSRVGDMGSFTLRTVQLTGQISKKLRMYAKYDNSLTMDLAALVRANQEAQAFSLGGVVPWNKKLTTRIEYGTRLLPDNVTQQIYSGEQVIFLPNRLNLKFGGFFGASTKMPGEWLAYTSVRVPLNAYYAIEPYYFYSRVEGAPRPENRFMLNNQFRTHGGYELNLGLFYGKAGLPRDVDDDNIFGSYATALVPFTRTIWGQCSLRWEKAPFDNLLALAFGIKLRLEK
jgi:Flp pilus assembly protein TadD